MSDVKDFLEHYGVKGMRWGIRRKRTSSEDSSNTSSSSKSVKDMSDDELRKVINRMQMEKQYSDLVKGSSRSTSKTVLNFISNVGSTAVKSALTGLATQQVNSALKKATATK